MNKYMALVFSVLSGYALAVPLHDCQHAPNAYLLTDLCANPLEGDYSVHYAFYKKHPQKNIDIQTTIQKIGEMLKHAPLSFELFKNETIQWPYVDGLSTMPWPKPTLPLPFGNYKTTVNIRAPDFC